MDIVNRAHANNPNQLITYQEVDEILTYLNRDYNAQKKRTMAYVRNRYHFDKGADDYFRNRIRFLAINKRKDTLTTKRSVAKFGKMTSQYTQTESDLLSSEYPRNDERPNEEEKESNR